jgi:hypothetical protein
MHPSTPTLRSGQLSPDRLKLATLLNDLTVTVSKIAGKPRTPTKGEIMDQ